MKRVVKAAVFSLAAVLSAPALAAPAAEQPLPSALAGVHTQLMVGPAGFSGPGAPVLAKALQDARFIAVGEDHITREIPAFVGRLCDAVAPSLSGLVLEVGPTALSVLRPALGARDRLSRVAAFNRQYPHAIAFLDTRADNDMVARCLTAQPRLRLVGVDQEFLGSAGMLIDLILKERLSAPARAAMIRLRSSERQRAASAAKSGRPDELLLLGASDDELARAQAALRKGGTQQARAIFASLMKSRAIYRTDGNASNRARADLLKKQFRAQVPAQGKVILKMGDWHIYRGYNPLNNRDLGNWVAEAADAEGGKSLHILILGAKGVHATFGGYQRPLGMTPFVMTDDRDYKWLQTALDAAGTRAPGAWDMFDLRGLQESRRLTGVDAQWRRVLDGFDLLIVIPQLSPSEMIAAG